MTEWKNQLWYGDCLNVLADHVAPRSVDLVYLDPPFNSKKTYNVYFKTPQGDDGRAQADAFSDYWTWGDQSISEYEDALNGVVPAATAEALTGMRILLGESDLMAYLVMMTRRLVALEAVMSPTSTIYLHCDPTASHYLKVMMDSIFGGDKFGNELVWAYKYGGRSIKHFGRKHDVILRYTKHKTDFVFNSKDPLVRVPHEEDSIEHNFRHTDDDGRRYREDSWKGHSSYRYYADEGRLRDSVITDINSLHSQEAERLGYPTQKPLSLLKLLIAASSNEGDLVLDPFCGCGTAVDAAQELGRRWVGVDISTMAIKLIQERLKSRYGSAIEGSSAKKPADPPIVPFETGGVPEDLPGAQALWDNDDFEFERWAAMTAGFEPKEKRGGDGGIDGVAYFPSSKTDRLRVIVSIKGGTSLTPSFIRDLKGTLTEQAPLGVLISLHRPTKGMYKTAASNGRWTNLISGKSYPVTQIITIEELLDGKTPELPELMDTNFKASTAKLAQQQAMF